MLYPKGSKVETCLTKTQMCPVACVAGAKFSLGEGRNFEDARALEGRGRHKRQTDACLACVADTLCVGRMQRRQNASGLAATQANACHAN